jgi:hypothetical protein
VPRPAAPTRSSSLKPIMGTLGLCPLGLRSTVLQERDARRGPHDQECSGDAADEAVDTRRSASWDALPRVAGPLRGDVGSLGSSGAGLERQKWLV